MSGIYDPAISGRSGISDEELWRANGASSNGSSPEARRGDVSRLLVLAYILAVSIPPAGLVLGVAVAIRPGRTRHGIAIVALSLVTALVWVVLLTSGSLDTGSSTNY